MQYDQFKNNKSEGKKFGKYISLSQELAEEGDELRLKLKNMEKIPADKARWGVTRWRFTVLQNSSDGAVEKTLEVDGPDEKNNMRGSQVYRGMAENDIQPGDIFIIKYAGKMDNDYKTRIYNVMKEIVSDQGDIKEQNKLVDDVKEVFEEDVRIEDMEI